LGQEINVATAPIPKDRTAARIAMVEKHVRLENAHDLEGVLGTFGETPRYDDEPWGEHYTGRNGVQLFYEQLMKALPDLDIEVVRRHVSDELSFWKCESGARIWVNGAVCLPPGGALISRSVAFTPSTPTIVWLARKSITTVPRS
jgi:hypothetical protein